MNAWRALSLEQRRAGLAAAALGFTLLLPWYEKSFFATVRGVPTAASDSLNAIQVFSFIEAAVLLVALAILYLLYARSEKRAFHLPGGDGTVIFAAGVWVELLLVWRLFDKPNVEDPGATIGIQWGLFGAMVAAGVLIVAGQRLVAAHIPEPANPLAEEPEASSRGRGARRRRPVDPAAVTEALRAPSWSGEAPEAPGRARPARLLEQEHAAEDEPPAEPPAPAPGPPDRLF